MIPTVAHNMFIHKFSVTGPSDGHINSVVFPYPKDNFVYRPVCEVRSSLIQEVSVFPQESVVGSLLCSTIKFYYDPLCYLPFVNEHN